MHRRCRVVTVLTAAILLFAAQIAACASNLPQPDHVVLVILENHSFKEVVDSDLAPFIYRLAKDGALFVNSFAVSHPSQPNYLALFSGSTQGVHDNDDHMFDAPTLVSALNTAGKSFVGYVEAGSPRRHNPWESFVGAIGAERDLGEFSFDFTRLPTISFVIPNLENDMHDGSVREGDLWLKTHLGSYAEWARRHNSLLIVTFDEDNYDAGNHIPTIIYGAHVKSGEYARPISHYSVLSTLLALYSLPPFAEVATTAPIDTIWTEMD